MQNFLKKFSGTIRSRQTQQILKLLHKRREKGSVRNFQEFRDQFQQLAEELAGETLIPTLKFYPAIPLAEVSVETYNEMLERTSDDLIASFEQLTKVEQVQANHEAIIKDLVFNNIRLSMNELRTKINLYKFINTNIYGFENGIYSTFNEGKENRTNRALEVPNKLFVDPRNLKFLNSTFDADIDFIAEKLSLTVDQKKEVPIGSIQQVLGGEFKTSVYTLNGEPESLLSNVVDSVNGTYWNHTIRRMGPGEIVKVKLRLELNSRREINYIEIEPSHMGNILVEIQYVDGGGALKTISVGEAINRKIKIPFTRIATDTLYLIFQLPNSEEVQYENSVLDEFNPLEDYVFPTIAEEILQVPTLENDSFVCYEYKMGLDNVRTGLSEYNDKSLYVSKPLLLKEETGTMGLISKEERPYDDNNEVLFTTDVATDRPYLGSIEYWIIKEELDSDDFDIATVVNTVVFPIMPLGTKEISKERLVLSETSDDFAIAINDIGSLTHFPKLNAGGTAADDLKIYKNNVIMDPAGYIFHNDTTSLPLQGKRMNYKVHIKGVKNPGDIYTATYTPMLANTYSVDVVNLATEQVDLSGDLSVRVGPESIILLDETQDERVESYRIYLVVILRQNTAKKEVSPFLQEYTLSVGKRDLQKFEAVT
jgi:hypothetical protein